MPVPMSNLSALISQKPNTDGWRPVRIQLKDGGTRVTKGYVVKELIAIHDWKEDPKLFSVSSLKLGMSLTRVETFVDAVKVTKVLLDYGKEALTKITAEDCRAAFPRWIDGFCIACTKAGKYLDPTEFIEKYKD